MIAERLAPLTAAIGEGWVEQRGRSMVSCRAGVTGATSGRLCANATLVYKVSTGP